MIHGDAAAIGIAFGWRRHDYFRKRLTAAVAVPGFVPQQNNHTIVLAALLAP